VRQRRGELADEVRVQRQRDETGKRGAAAAALLPSGEARLTRREREEGQRVGHVSKA
jgi:hypothetical protein